MLLTFGLLSPNKGIENVIEALPSILAQHPNVVYIILGATHPNVIARDGESYRLKLERLAEDRSVTRTSFFTIDFVTQEELKEFIGAADIYITPYLNESQITSGTLAYTFGAGKAVISTPYWHAKELLAKERGILVPFSDPRRIAEGVNRFLCDPVLMTATRKRAWKLGRGDDLAGRSTAPHGKLRTRPGEFDRASTEGISPFEHWTIGPISCRH